MQQRVCRESPITRPDDRHGRSPPEDRARRAAAGGTSEGRQPLVDVHGVHGRDAHVAIVRRPHVRAIGHANRAYEVFRRYRQHCVAPEF